MSYNNKLMLDNLITPLAHEFNLNNNGEFTVQYNNRNYSFKSTDKGYFMKIGDHKYWVRVSKQRYDNALKYKQAFSNRN